MRIDSDMPAPPDDDAPDAQLLDQYWVGDLPTEEAERLNAWFATHPERRARYEEIGATFNARRGSMYSQAERDARISDIMQAAGVASTVPSAKPVASNTQSSRFRRIAAVVGVTAIGLAGIVMTPLRHLVRNSESPTVVREYTTLRAQRAVVDLPDGSRVTLAPESRLRFASTTHGARDIQLSGQAHFVVAHDGARPFVVRTGLVRTEVLGTEFDVRRYATDRETQVAVVTGKVASGGVAPSVILTPGVIGQIPDSTAATVTNNRDLSTLTSWVRGTLSFVDAPVPDMLATVGRWSGYEFRLADSTLATQYVTATLSVDDPAGMLKNLQDLLGVRATIRGRVVTLAAPSRTSKSAAPERRRTRETYSIPSEIGK